MPSRFSASRRVARSACLLAVLLPAAAEAQDSTRTERRIQPLPALGSAPETGLQLGLTVLAVFESPAARRARPASLIATAVRSTKGQTRISAEGEHWSANNARRLHGLLAWQKFPLPFYGIGGSAPERARELYTPTGIEAIATVQQRLRGAWYALATARLIDQRITHDSASGALATTSIMGRSGGRVSEVTTGVLRDSRDVVFNPRRGTFAQFTVTASRPALGSDFSYGRVRADARRYLSLGGEHVLAAQALVIGTTGEAPFDQLALVGGGDILRGYTRGRYRDAWLSAAQLEYRTPLVRRVGAVLFAGAGTIAAEAGALVDGPLLPTYGLGVRAGIDARQRTAVRIDYGRGREGATGLYIGFNQAF